MRILGIDFGGKHIGVAVGESDSRLCSIRKPITASGTLAKDAEAIRKIYAHEEAEMVVVGLPLDGTGETKMSKICRQLGERVSALGIEVQYVDEALTSHEAETAMKQAGMKGAQIRKSVDGEAACRILLRFMESNAEEA